jgi:hypothetical protein
MSPRSATAICPASSTTVHVAAANAARRQFGAGVAYGEVRLTLGRA